MSIFTGNLSQMEWSVKGEEFTRSYLFEYDGLDRLRQSVYGELTSSSGQVNHKFDVEISGYDKHGNLLGLKRRGLISLPLFRPDGGTFPSTGSPGSFGVIDDLRFEYRGNRVTSVSDSSPNDPSYKDAMHFVDGSDASAEYVYDGNGNMVSDGNKQLELIEYDVHNLPRFIRQSKIYTSGFYPSGRPRPFRRELIDYVYDASGRKLQVRYTTERGQSVPGSSSSPPSGIVSWQLNTKRDYCDNFIYENDTLSMILTSAGFVSVSGNTLTPYYHLRDYQGNVRVVTDSQGSVLQVNHYYPFGGLFGDSHGGAVQPFKYGGKELDRMLGRFMSVDPLCEKYYSVSPYAYCLNNPVKYVDPDGRDVWIKHHTGFLGLRSETLRYENGSLFNQDGTGYTGKISGFLNDAMNALGLLVKTAEGASLVAELQQSSNMFTIEKGSYNSFKANSNIKAGANLSEFQIATGIINGSKGSGGTIYWNSLSTVGGIDLLGGVSRPTYIGLGHELGHANDANQGLLHFNNDYVNPVTGAQYISTQSGLLKSEWRAVYHENLIRSQSGLPLRTYYGYDIATGNPSPIGPRLLNSANKPLNYP